jgi:hypothetical protein
MNWPISMTASSQPGRAAGVACAIDCVLAAAAAPGVTGAVAGSAIVVMVTIVARPGYR